MTSSELKEKIKILAKKVYKERSKEDDAAIAYDELTKFPELKSVIVDLLTSDFDKFLEALKFANIDEWVESLPLSYKTKIGEDGHGISEGQKQRILIARVIYKNPKLIILDEATNTLDSINEKLILENLKLKCKNKILVVVAHRLSTIKDADQILVLDQGKIVESGNHQKLIKQKGKYFHLIKNQS